MAWEWRYVPEDVPGGGIWVAAHVGPYQHTIKWVSLWQAPGGVWWLGVMFKTHDLMTLRLENPAPELIQDAHRRAEAEVKSQMSLRG